MEKSEFDIYFNNAMATMNQTKFEEWFAKMASRVYGTDFELIKAGGHHGDKKSDGRRISTETVYQCYAPESPATFTANAAAKINDSFPAVLSYWPKLKEWVFIHNNVDGIPTKVSDTVEAVRTKYPHVTISTASRSFLKDELHDKLTLQQLIDVYPSASLNFSGVQMQHVRPLLKAIIDARTVNPDSDSFGEIPDESKLDFNALSLDSKHDIIRARPHIGIVDRYLAGVNNPQNVSIIQAEMRAKYLQLKDLGYDPDEILGKLLTFCFSGDTSTGRTAALIVVAYFFDACDIFENSPLLVC